jgi:hypothetical protein
MPKSKTQKAIEGLQRLAFGKVNDAVALAFADEIPPAEVLSKMNLFNVSAIKRVKGGGVEVQFFDRQKALERLYEYAREDASGQSAASLLAALTGGKPDGN